MATISRGLDKLATLGLPIHITEYSSPGNYLPSQQARGNRRAARPASGLSREEMAAFACNFYTLASSKPYVAELDRWYVVDTISGRGQDVGLIDVQGNLTPEYHALRKLLPETWTTKVQGVLRAGEFAFTGFYGTYRVKLQNGKTAQFELKRDTPKTLEIALR